MANNCLVTTLKGTANMENYNILGMSKLTLNSNYITENPSSTFSVGLNVGGKIKIFRGNITVDGNNVSDTFTSNTKKQYTIGFSGTLPDNIFIEKSAIYQFTSDMRLINFDLNQFEYCDNIGYFTLSSRATYTGSLKCFKNIRTYLSVNYTNISGSLDEFSNSSITTLECLGSGISGDFASWIPVRNTGNSSSITVKCNNANIKCNGVALMSLEGSGTIFIVTFDGNGHVSAARA